MAYRVVPQLVMLAGCLAVVSGCATGRTGGLFSSQTSHVENAHTQQISLARLSERHGNHAGAKKLYRAVLAETPQHPIALHRMGVIAGKEGDFDQAIDYLTQASSVNGPTAEIYSDLGYVYYLQDQHELAMQTFEKSLELDPDYAAARTNLGIVYAELGEDERALQQFRRSLGEAEALSSLAYIQSQRGNLDLAEQNYLKALDLDKNLRPAAEALAQLAERTGRADARPDVPIAAAPRPALPESLAQNMRPTSAQAPSATQSPVETHVAPQAGSSPAAPLALPEPSLVATSETASPDSATDNPLRSTSRFAPAKMASIEMFRPSPLTQVQSVPAPQGSQNTATVTPVNYASAPSAAASGSANSPAAGLGQANGGLVIPTQDLGTMPAVYQISDQPKSHAVQQPPISASKIGSVQSASAQSFSQEIFKALQSASGP